MDMSEKEMLDWLTKVLIVVGSRHTYMLTYLDAKPLHALRRLVGHRPEVDMAVVEKWSKRFSVIRGITPVSLAIIDMFLEAGVTVKEKK